MKVKKMNGSVTHKHRLVSVVFVFIISARALAPSSPKLFTGEKNETPGNKT